MTGWAPGVPRNSSANFLGWGRGGRHAFTEAAPAVSPGGEEYRLPRPADQGGASIAWDDAARTGQDRKSTRLNSSHITISYAVFCLKKKKQQNTNAPRNTPAGATRAAVHLRAEYPPNTAGHVPIIQMDDPKQLNCAAGTPSRGHRQQ